jgi:hypothetical protein
LHAIWFPLGSSKIDGVAFLTHQLNTIMSNLDAAARDPEFNPR